MANYGRTKRYFIEADGTAVTNTTTETSSASISIPANHIVAGDRLEIRALVEATATNSTDTSTCAIRLGGASGVLVVQSDAVDVADNDMCVLTGTVYFDSVGSAAEVHAYGIAGWTTTGADPVTYGTTDDTNTDTTAALTVDCTIDWSVANAGNSALCKDLSVYHFRSME